MKIRTCISAALLLLLASSLWAMGQAAAKNPVVVLETSMGTIKVEVYADKAPITAKNFLTYVNTGFYNNTIIHRVDFAVCGGGYTEIFGGKPTRAAIQNESKNGLKNLRGTLAMARYDDPNSATSQWFINLKDNSHLDATATQFGYAVFAKVIEGMDVVDKIGKVKTTTKGAFYNTPVETIMVKSAKVE